MYSLRQRIYPALGREGEVRALVTEMAKYSQGKGRDVALLSRIFSSEGSALVAVTRAESLDALESYRRENTSDGEWLARAAKLSGMLRAPVQVGVFDMVIPPSGSGPAGIVARAHGFPALGKERQARSVLEEYVQSSQRAGVRQGLGVALFSATGPTLEITTVHESLAALERTRQERRSQIAEVAQAMGEISRAPIAQRIFEVVVPFAR